MSSDSVQAVVVTHNRKGLLLECLAGIARQSHPVRGVLVVDNASTDGTEEALAKSGLGARLRLDYLRLERNGGGAEGFHYGVRHSPGSAARVAAGCGPAPRSCTRTRARSPGPAPSPCGATCVTATGSRTPGSATTGCGTWSGAAVATAT